MNGRARWATVVGLFIFASAHGVGSSQSAPAPSASPSASPAMMEPAAQSASPEPSSAPTAPPTPAPTPSPTASPTPAPILHPVGPYVPAKAAVQFHVNAPLSSATSKSGQLFTFTLIAPLVATNPYIKIPTGSQGVGLLVLAGHAGQSGHEGDLTLQLLHVTMPGRRELDFQSQRFEINGRNQKITSGVLGFVPFVGFGARFIRGAEITVDPKNPILTVLTYPALVISPKVPKPMMRDRKAP